MTIIDSHIMTKLVLKFLQFTFSLKIFFHIRLRMLVVKINQYSYNDLSKGVKFS